MKAVSSGNGIGEPGLKRRIKAWLRKLAIRLICLAVAAIGLAFWPFGRRRQDFDQRQIKKILVLRLDLLGDLVLTMTAIEALQDAFPEAAISALSLPYTTPLLDHYPFLAKVFAFDINRLRPSGEMLSPSPYRDLWRLLRALRSERFDLAVSFHGIWASVLAFASGAPFRAGFCDESCPLMLNLAIPGKRYRIKRHEADYCLDLARSLGAKEADRNLSLSPLPAAEATVSALLDRPGSRKSESLVAVHVGATNGAAKRWTTGGMAEVADRLAEEDGATIVFTGSQGDLPAVRETAGQMRHAPLILAGMTSLPELIALIARCRLLISGDTGPMHLAIALGVPVVAIHGPTDPALSGPYGGAAIVVRNPVPCGPCYDLSATADCPLGNPLCMTGISAGEVYAAAKKQLAERNPANRRS